MELPPGLILGLEERPSLQDEDLLGDALGGYNAPFLHNPTYAYFGQFDAQAIRASLGRYVYVPGAGILPQSSGTANSPASTTRRSTSGFSSRSN